MRNLIKQILKEGDLEWAEDIVAGQELPFEIMGPTKPPPTKKNRFVIEVEWMSGDADSYNTERYDFEEKDPKDFESFIHACRLFKILEQDRRGYHGWEDLNRLINPHGYYTRSRVNKPDSIDMSDFINSDVMSDGQNPAGFDGVDIKYYNNDGVEYDVKLV